MKFGGRCPLNNMFDKEKFLKKELENFYKKQIEISTEEMKKEFCINICKNIAC